MFESAELGNEIDKATYEDPHQYAQGISHVIVNGQCALEAGQMTGKLPGVPIDVIRMIEAATHAPSAENSQPWEFVVVRSPEARHAVDSLTRRIWEGGGRAHAEASVGPDKTACSSRRPTKGRGTSRASSSSAHRSG